MRKLLLSLLPVLVPVAMNAGPIIFSTNGTDTLVGINSSADSLQAGHLEEIQFVATATGQLGSLAVVMESPAAITENFDILTDNAGNPGTLIDTIPIVLTVTVSTIPTLFTGLSTMNPLLTAGTTYWISPEAPSPSTVQTQWSQASPTIDLQTYFNGNPFLGPLPAPAFALLSTPEPATAALLGLGLGGLLLVRRKLSRN